MTRKYENDIKVLNSDSVSYLLRSFKSRNVTSYRRTRNQFWSKISDQIATRQRQRSIYSSKVTKPVASEPGLGGLLELESGKVRTEEWRPGAGSRVLATQWLPWLLLFTVESQVTFWVLVMRRAVGDTESRINFQNLLVQRSSGPHLICFHEISSINKLP